jgi:excisionase family DNA binding protein
VAKNLNVSRETIYKWAQRGEIPASKLGHQWRFNQTYFSLDEVFSLVQT